MKYMEFDIIKTEYLKKLKNFSPYYRFIAIIASILLILEYAGIDVFDGNQIFKNLSTSFIIIFFILEILNGILFSRIGVINFGSENIVISKDGKCLEFVLSNIQLVEISKVQSKHYSIHAKPGFKETIELSENDLTKLKTYFKVNQIDCKTKSIMNWIKKKIGFKNDE